MVFFSRPKMKLPVVDTFSIENVCTIYILEYIFLFVILRPILHGIAIYLKNAEFFGIYIVVVI
jgi:hypothetical protein